MKPPQFRYLCPTSVEEALQLLGELGDAYPKILAGGQSLMPLLNMRLVRPSHVIDVNRLAELSFVREEADGGLSVGAMTRHRALEKSTAVASRTPLIAEAIELVGDRQIRVRGTLGGSLAHADPAAELPVVALGLDAQIVVRRHEQTRTINARDFFQAILTTALEPEEMLTEVRFPPLPPRTGCAFIELARQHGAFAIVAVAATLSFEAGRIASASIALGGVAPIPIRADRAEQVLRGEAPTPAVFAEAARLAAEATDPSGDVHGSEAYRREMAGVFTRRALEAASKRGLASAAAA